MIDIERTYDKKFGDYPSDNVKSLGWSGIHSQQLRFKILTEIGIKNHHSILDVGCGHGDFYDYSLIKSPQSLSKVLYVGIDLRESVIDIAIKKHPDALRDTFFVSEIKDIENKFDWVIGSGIFCFKDKNWFLDTVGTIQSMIDKSKLGVAVNFLSDFATHKRDEDMKYTTLLEIFDIITGLDKQYKFVIRNDYAPNDMTVYFYKS